MLVKIFKGFGLANVLIEKALLPVMGHSPVQCCLGASAPPKQRPFLYKLGYIHKWEL